MRSGTGGIEVLIYITSIEELTQGHGPGSLIYSVVTEWVAFGTGGDWNAGIITQWPPAAY